MNERHNRQKRRMGKVGIFLSVLLLLLKAWAAVISSSTAVLSDALNAFLDVVTYTAVYVCIRIQDRAADDNHPFGHRRAEPLAGLLVAVFASVLGATIVRDAFMGLFQPSAVHVDPFSFGLLLISLVVKGAMTVWYRRGWRITQSPALRASYVDSRNDVLTSAVAIYGFLAGGQSDDLAALAIGGWIVYSGIRVGLENIGYLMGEAPPPSAEEEFRTRARTVSGVVGLNDLRAHYVGDKVHVELHIEVPKEYTLQAAHDIGVEVKRRLESLPIVHKAFIHIDPV